MNKNKNKFKLKIIDNVDLNILKEYGFKKEPENQYFYLKEDEVEIFVWKGIDSAYKKRYIYIELEDHILVSEIPSIIFDLINAGLIEKVIENGD